jgi:phosphotransferase system enzyme I (PtsP)
LMMLRDQSWLGAMEALIVAGTPAAEAVYRVVHDYVDRFDLMEDAYIREKRLDVLDVGRRLLGNLTGRQSGETAFEGRIAVASELLPSDVLMLGLQKVGGLVLLSGGVTSHVSVLARSLDLPLLIVEDPRLLQIPDGTRVVLDGTQGNLLVGPTAEVEEKFREQTELRQSALHLGERMLDTTHTSDGTRVRLLANINLLADLDVARAYKAEGVGLYRTEFPFMIRNDFPSEEEQIRVYRRLVESMPGREITFRTLDVGSDKMLSYFNYGAEANPFLGLRSIRLSLRHRDLFLQQLRAILRAAHDAEVRIMFPMITSPDELDQAADAVDECRAALQREGAQSCSEVRIGMMLEVPSVLELMDQLAKRAEFFSIGTNDFIQYMLAVDRTNANIADMYLPHHPAVLRGLHRAVLAVLRLGRDISICGDMAHDPRLVRFFLGIGVRKFSVGARYLPRLQEAVLATSLDAAQAFAERLLAESTVAGTARVLEAG